MFIAMQTETLWKSLPHGEQKPFNIGDMAAAYLKHFRLTSVVNGCVYIGKAPSI